MNTPPRRLLALDTATEACSVATWVDGVVQSQYAELGRGHGERILPMIDAALASAKLRLAQLDAIAFGCGPGGFTGVRLACSVTQGLAFGAQLQVVPISNLRALAARALQLAPAAQQVWVCADARMREVYFAVYGRGRDASAELVGTEAVGPAATALAHFRESKSGVPNRSDLALAGRGWQAYSELLDAAGVVKQQGAAVFDALLPSAEDIVRLGVRDTSAGLARPASGALPVYLRDNVAVAAPAP